MKTTLEDVKWAFGNANELMRIYVEGGGNRELVQGYIDQLSNNLKHLK